MFPQPGSIARGGRYLPIGYVSTIHGMRPESAVQNDIKAWRALYPEVQYVYVSELGLPNPWKQLPSYLDSLFSTLDGQPASATTPSL